MAIEFIERAHALDDQLYMEGHFLAEAQPELLWEMILHVIRANPSEEALGILGAAFLEDLMWNHAPAFIARAEEQAQRLPELASLLSGIYRGEIDDETWARIVKISGREREMYRLADRASSSSSD